MSALPSCPRGLVLRIGDRIPRIHPSVFIAPMALVVGDVVLEEDASVWPGCVLRGDYGAIRIGPRSNVQDGTIIHATEDLATVLGAGVVVGHGARLEGCTVDDGALIGMGSVLLHRVTVGSGAIVGAGAVLSAGTRVPAGAMALGVPASVREAPDAQTIEQRRALTEVTAALYVENARRWMREAADTDARGV